MHLPSAFEGPFLDCIVFIVCEPQGRSDLPLLCLHRPNPSILVTDDATRQASRTYQSAWRRRRKLRSGTEKITWRVGRAVSNLVALTACRNMSTSSLTSMALLAAGPDSAVQRRPSAGASHMTLRENQSTRRPTFQLWRRRESR